MKKTALLLILNAFFALNMHSAAVGTWKAYMAYHDITEIAKGGNTLYTLASGSLFAYNTNDNSVTTYDKAGGLSDCRIVHIGWCSGPRRLVIAYDTGNIDVLSENGNVVNVPDLYLKSMTGDKQIYDIYGAGDVAYVATGFGIIKLNTSTYEISDTYNLGFKVDYTYLDGGKLYAASAEKGLYACAVNTNLANRNNWTRAGDYVTQPAKAAPELLKMVQTANPGGPKYNEFAFLRFTNGALYGTRGGYNVVQDLYLPGCIQVLKNDEWTIFQDDINDQIGPNLFEDVAAIDVDPLDENHVFASGKKGIYEFRNAKFVRHYTYDNSILGEAFPNNKDYVVVQGIKFDTQGNLWAANSATSKANLVRLSPQGEWTSLPQEGLRGKYNLCQLTFDSRGKLWILNDNWSQPGFYAYDPKAQTLTPFTRFYNEDGTQLKLYTVHCMAEDKAGNMWIGTDRGPLMLPAQNVETPDATLVQVKVPRNDGSNYADYLLDGIDITCMAVDDAGRKWFGTKANGVYLISQDNMQQLLHFQADNSKLLSDNILSIAINNATGEVFFGTDRGLCSYIGDATTANEEMTNDNVWAYPNPVRPEYTGPVTITGLSYDADVKIVTSSGALVKEGRSTGGTFIWDATDLKGRRVASGVYIVLTATSAGDKGAVCKIAVVN